MKYLVQKNLRFFDNFKKFSSLNWCQAYFRPKDLQFSPVFVCLCLRTKFPKMSQKPPTNANPDAVVYKNSLVGTGCEKLYLDARTSDVTFQFAGTNGGECVELPAHKSILSAISPVFDAMFFGPAKELGDVRIVDVAPAAFKDFLQFFYLTHVKLNADHLIDVMNLGKQYMINDCLVACTEFCVATLQLENVCWGYELAILFDLDELRAFCERKICQHPMEVFRSTAFLNCDVDLLQNILRLTAFECNEATIFDGCMTWAKQACLRSGEQPNARALRSQLNDLFYEIRFGEFTHKQFHVRYRLYDGLFSLEEFRDITMMIACKEFQSATKFKRMARNAIKRAPNDYDEQICDRKAVNHTVWYRVERCEQSNACIDKTVFESSMPQQLKQFRCSAKFQGINATTKIRISELNEDDHVQRKSLLYFAIVTLSSSEETTIELPTPINVQPGRKYEIKIELEDGYMYSSELVRNNVRMDNGNVIKFSGKQLGMQSLVKIMHFGAIDE